MSNPTAESRARDCAVCGRPLDHTGFKDETGKILSQAWVHLDQTLTGDLDHIPVPVERGQIKTVYRCDFCNLDTKRMWVIPASDFQMPELINTSIGDWTACKACANYIIERDWPGLIQQVFTAPTSSVHDEPWARDWLLRSYTLLGEHMTGEPYEMTR